MDQIKRKLALIDKQLAAGPANFHKQIISTCPLLFVATGLIAGILIQNSLIEPRATGDEPRLLCFWLILLVLPAISAVLFFVLQAKNKLGSYALVLLNSCALICFTCLGAIRLSSFHQPAANDIRNFIGQQRQLATIRGPIITDPIVNKNRDWEFARFKFTDPATSFYLKVREAETTTGWKNVTGTVRVHVNQPVLDLKAGDYIQIYCWLDRFKPATNPGQFDIAKYLARKNIFIAASVKSRDAIEILQSGNVSTFTKLKRKLRQLATQSLLGDLSPQDTSRGLLQALLLGYRANIDKDTYRAFQKTGLLHFISLSGLHLGILVGIIWWLCKTAGLMKRARAAVCIISIIIFLLIVPPRAPTLRAAIICLVFCISLFFRRYSNPINTLSLAAIILLLIRPTMLFEAGWQLSFVTVLGILLFCRRIHSFMYEKITSLPFNKKAPRTKPYYQIIPRMGPYILALFSTGLSGWLTGAGILLYHFHTINPLTSIWTVIAFPFVALILTIGFLKIIFSLLLPTIAAILGIIVTILSDSLIWIVQNIADWNISQILIGKVTWLAIVCYYCIVIFVAYAYFRRPLIKKIICTLMIAAIIVFLGTLKYQRTHRDNLILTCLDVGHGQAILAQLPGKANVLFDAGALHKSNISQRVIIPFLDYMGINKIDAIVISHNDIDHINGIPELAANCKVGAVYANDAFFSKADRWGTAKFLDESLKEKSLEIKALDNDLNIKSGANIKILWPDKQASEDQTLSDNDKSAVALIEFAGKKILLSSDIEKFAQQQILQLFPNLTADIVTIPHHGSAKSLAPDFLQNLQPEILICSCSQTQYQRQKNSQQKNFKKSFYTPTDGAITICINKNGTITPDIFIKPK